MKKMILAAVAAFLFSAGPALCQAWNGTGSTTHSASVTPYTAGELFAGSATPAVPSTITIANVPAGTQQITKAMMQSSGTNQPPSIILWLFASISSAPITTGLTDYSPYIGPYAADILAGKYLGALTCGTWQKTNDGTAQYFTECSGSSLMINAQPIPAGGAATTLQVLEEINGPYTPLSGEKHSYFVSTLRDN